MERGAALRIAGMYVAIMLGAGFASGQELGSFFVKFGGIGALGIIASGVVFALVGWAVFEICRVRGITGYAGLTESVMGRWLGSVMRASAALFLFVLMATMFAATGAFVNELWGVPSVYGVAVMSALTFITMLLGMRRMVNINMVLAPVMVVGGVFIGLYAFFFGNAPAFSPFDGQGGWLVSAVIYASYNTVTAVPVLAAMSGSVTKPGTAFWGPVMGGAVMTILGLCLALPLFLSVGALDYEIPLLAIVSRFHIVIKGLYVVVLFTAIYTTAIANGFAFLESMGGVLNVGGWPVKAAVTVAAVAASSLGFSTFVGSVYPIFGVFGFIQAALLIYVLFTAKTGGRHCNARNWQEKE